jgi:hypothetical protein
MKLIAVSSITLMGFDFYVRAEVEVTNWGDPTPVNSRTILPPDEVEWHVESISLSRDEPGWIGPEWRISDRDALFGALLENKTIIYACQEAVYREARERAISPRHRRRCF